jgi:hypothetical protein
MSDLKPLGTQALQAPAESASSREKTRGEHLFNWSVYAGIGWVVNAALTLVALDWLEYNPRGKAIASSGEKAINKVLEKIPFKSEAARKGMAENIVFTAGLYVGGTLLVPVMKYFEDHKGSLVRKADAFFYGSNSETDAKLIRAHEEMDDTPKQSWGSMLKARSISLPLGILIGSAVGRPDAWSTKLLKGPVFDKWSSFTRIGARAARGWGENHPPAGVDAAAYRAQISAAREASPLAVTVAHDTRRVRLGSNTIYELCLSSFVAATFFATSHLFATLKHRKQDEGTAPALPALPQPSNDNPPVIAANDDDKPAAKVTAVQRHSAVAQAAPQHAQAH